MAYRKLSPSIWVMQSSRDWTARRIRQRGQDTSRSDVRPEQSEPHARLLSTIARGRQWLADVGLGSDIQSDIMRPLPAGPFLFP
jgi:hypothetical protein